MQPQMIKAQRRLMEPLDDEEYDRLMVLMSKVIDGNNEASRAPLRNGTHEEKCGGRTP